MSESGIHKSIVVLVHGLWQRGWSMAVLARRLRKRGHEVEVFSYPTTSHCLDAHADALQAFLAGLLHFCGKSQSSDHEVKRKGH